MIQRSSFLRALASIANGLPAIAILLVFGTIFSTPTVPGYTIPVSPLDSIPPTIISFSVSPTTVTQGHALTISYTVSDSGGSGLSRVELWRANDIGGTPSNWAEVRRNAASGSGPVSGSFSETLAAGIYWYGLHAVDQALNFRVEPNPPGPIRVIVNTADTMPPTISNFSISPGTVAPGSPFTISYTVSDSGGSGLSRVELWRANDAGGTPSNWAEVRRNAASGSGPVSGSFSETLPVGVYWYGLHVVDNAGNVRFEPNPPGPIRVSVRVTADTTPPVISDFSVRPDSVPPGSPFTISYTVSDSGGSGLSRVELWRANDAGGPVNWAEVRRNAASGSGPVSGSFSETLPAGTYWYGLHVVDNALNFRVEPAPIRVTVRSSTDTTPPTINTFRVDPLNVASGSPFTISYTVSDSGGSGLSRVELWRANDIGGTPSNWAEVRRNAASGSGSVSGSFSETLPVGTYWYGLHVVDNALNFRVEPAPIRVTVHTILDTTPPTITVFSASPTTLRPGSTCTISYTVSDSGGSGLSRVELWRANDAGGPVNWAEVRRNAASGNGPVSGSFSETPQPGVYWYSLHVWDSAGNMRSEPNPPGSIKVTVANAGDTTPPTISTFRVDPLNVAPGNPFTISYTVSDSGGSGLSRVELWRANDAGGPVNWAEVRRNAASGNGPVSGSFSETLPAGTYWYGLHAVDNALNFRVEPAPIRVTVSNDAAGLRISQPTQGQVFTVNQQNFTATGSITFAAVGNSSKVIWNVVLDYQTTGGPRGILPVQRSFQTVNTPFQDVFKSMGGRLTVNAQTVIGGQTRRTTATAYVMGVSIPDDVITARLMDLYRLNDQQRNSATPRLMTGVASKESSYFQFKNLTLYGQRGLWPNESASDGGSHIGLMQMPTTMPNAWDWKANTQAGVDLFREKLQSARRLVQRQVQTYPGLRNLNETEIENVALVLYGPFASGQELYYHPVRTANGLWDWAVNRSGNPHGVDYADDCRHRIK